MATLASVARPNYQPMLASPTLQRPPSTGGPSAQDFASFQQQGGMGNLGLRDQFTAQHFGGDQGAANSWFNAQSYGQGGQQVQHGAGSGEDRPWLIDRMNQIYGPGSASLATSNTAPGGAAGGMVPTPTSPASNVLGGAGGGAASAGPTQANGQPDWSKIDVSKFLDPNVGYRIEKGTAAVQNSAAAKGGLMSGNTLRGINDYAQHEAANAFQSAQDAAFNDRNFMRGTYQNDRDYSTALDEWNRNFDESRFRYGNDFNENARRYGQDFNESQRRYGNDFGESQRRYDTGVDQADRQFDYNARTGDRQFNYNSLNNLAQMGLSGATGNSQLMNQLAQLLSQNTLFGGVSAAQGTQGGSNAINQIISELLQQMSGNRTLNRQNPGP